MEEPDLLKVIRQVNDDIGFYRIVRAEAKRTVACPPALVDRMRWLVEQNGLDDLWTVVESSWVPEGQMWLIDEQTIEAGFRENLQTMGRRLFG